MNEDHATRGYVAINHEWGSRAEKWPHGLYQDRSRVIIAVSIHQAPLNTVGVSRTESFLLETTACTRITPERILDLLWSLNYNSTAVESWYKPCRHERGVTTCSKTMFSWSSVILFKRIRSGSDESCIFLIFTTRVGLKTRLNGVKSILFEKSRQF